MNFFGIADENQVFKNIEYLFIHTCKEPVRVKPEFWSFLHSDLSNNKKETGFYYTTYFIKLIYQKEIFYSAVLLIEGEEGKDLLPIMNTTLFPLSKKNEFIKMLQLPSIVFEDCDRYVLFYKDKIESADKLRGIVDEWKKEIHQQNPTLN